MHFPFRRTAAKRKFRTPSRPSRLSAIPSLTQFCIEHLEERFLLSYLPVVIPTAAPTANLSTNRLNSLSADGRYVGFMSFAKLVAGDTNQGSDVFLRDMVQNTITLVSTGGTQPANNFSEKPSISADGRFVAFRSVASNLVAGVSGQHVFVRDVVNRTNEVVSTGINGFANSYSDTPSISADGRYVAFMTPASNLATVDTNGLTDIYVRDRLSGTTILVSTGSNGIGNGDSIDPRISADGRFVVYTSSASNLGVGDNNGVSDVFVRDLQNGTTALISAGPSGIGNGVSDKPAISADGHFVAFSSAANNLISGDANGYSDIFVRDLQNGLVTLVSTGNNGPANLDSSHVSISGDGRFVAFASRAYNLTGTVPTGGFSIINNIFIRDLQNGTTSRITNQGGGSLPQISADGRHVAFYAVSVSYPYYQDGTGFYDNIFWTDDAPNVSGQEVRVSLNTSRAITLLANDAEATPLAYSFPTLPQHGTLSGNAPNLVYTPDPGYLGSDSFSFKADDGWLESAQAMVEIIVMPPEPPTVVSAAFSVDGTMAVADGSLNVIFNRSVFGASDQGSYSLWSAGVDELLGTADDASMAINQAIYTDKVATLYVPPLGSGNYRLTVKDLIVNEFNDRLDGDVDGQTGGDWEADFVVINSKPGADRLDMSFGVNGRVTTQIGTDGGQANAVAKQIDGKIVTAGYSVTAGNYDFSLVRYNADGSLDTGFGTGGAVNTPIGTSHDLALAVAIQPDEKIVAAGQARNGTDYDFALVRYHPDGSPDSTFGAGGMVVTPIGSSDEFAYAMVLQPDGTIVTVGYTWNGSNYDIAVVRY